LAVDISELPEDSMNKLIEFSRKYFRIVWEEKDKKNTKVIYCRIKELDESTQQLEIPSRSGKNFASSLKF